MTTFTEPRLVKLFKHNYKAMMSESAMFWVASAFIDSNTVVSVFLFACTGSIQLAGLGQVSRSVTFLLSQFIAGYTLMRVGNRARFMRIIGFLTRGAVLLMVPALLLGTGGYPAAFLLLFCLVLFNIGDGYVGLIWTGISARTIPDRMRGQMIGNAQIIAGLLSLAAGFVIKWILSGSLPQEGKYSVIFGICGVLYLLNAVILCFVKDRDDAPYPVADAPKLSEYFAQFKDIFTGMPRVRRVVLSRAVYTLSLMASTLVVLFGAQRCGLSDSQVSSMVYVQMAGVLVGGLFWGRLSRYFSTVTVMLGSMSMAIIIGALGVTAFLLGGEGVAVVFAMVFLTGFNQSSWVGYTNELLRLSSEHTRNAMLVMQSVLQLPVSFGPYFAGLIAENFGFLPVFIIVLLCGGLGLAMCGGLRKTDAIAHEGGSQ